jgi:Uncharacterized homolog of phage Mu protein gp47
VEYTYEAIQQRMRENAPSNIDKRESSVFYIATAPAAVELAIAHTRFDNLEKNSFADTASREYLIRRARERGLYPHPAHPSILKGVFEPNTLELEIGKRFSIDNLNYVVIGKISAGEYQLECEVAGSIGNTRFGNLLPIEFIQGLRSAMLVDLLIPGEDEEDTEAFRKRYFDSFNLQSFGGNISDYLEKTNAIAGVGSTKVSPVWNGGGTVLLTILDAEFNKASDVLVNTVQQTIDPTGDGYGFGLAPIGHVVTVQTVKEISLSICTRITFDMGYTFEGLRVQIEQAIKGYLLSLRAEWVNTNGIVIRVAQIESAILAISGIADISGTSINGVFGNLKLLEFEIPSFGGIDNG